MSNLHKETKKQFSEVIADLFNMKHEQTGVPIPMISEKYYRIITDNAEKLDAAIVYDRDFQYQYFGFKTLERSYLLKINGKTVERPQVRKYSNLFLGVITDSFVVGWIVIHRAPTLNFSAHSTVLTPLLC